MKPIQSEIKMSSYLVDKETIDAAVSAVISVGGFMSLEAATKLGRSLWSLNIAALKARYNDPDDDNYDCVNSYLWTPTNQPQTVLAKCLSCLLYQCAEGDVPNHPLYQKMRGVEAHFESLKGTPEYEAAPWGLPEYA